MTTLAAVGATQMCDKTGRALGIGRIPGKPQGRPMAVVVPVTGVSRLAQYGISAALSISEHVEAVTVVPSGEGEESERVRELQRQWVRWNPGVPLRVLRTEYASVARPIVAFVDRLRRRCSEPLPARGMRATMRWRNAVVSQLN